MSASSLHIFMVFSIGILTYVGIITMPALSAISLGLGKVRSKGQRLTSTVALIAIIGWMEYLTYLGLIS